MLLDFRVGFVFLEVIELAVFRLGALDGGVFVTRVAGFSFSDFFAVCFAGNCFVGDLFGAFFETVAFVRAEPFCAAGFVVEDLDSFCLAETFADLIGGLDFGFD